MSVFKTPMSCIRRPTRVVSVGNVKVGGTEPVRIQSMLTSDTTNVESCLKEIVDLSQVHCELIRLTVPNQKSLESLPAIRHGMQERGIDIPLIADIHFNPKLAIGACEFVEKVRINPGNYADRKRFEIREYTDAQYQEELERIEEKLLPLIANLKKYNRALRIGTNHGSLSDRVLNRYGDTPEGMVESALEFVRIFQHHDYHDIIISMKSSIPLVMMQAYRLLVVQMEQEGMNYPLHLGVTEAGNGLDGRVKSAIGIGSLLNDGIGDTIRVSLTEPAPNEIPAASSILESVESLQTQSAVWEDQDFETSIPLHTTPTDKVTVQSIPVGGTEPFRFFAMSPFVIDGLPPETFDAILPFPRAELPKELPSSTTNVVLFEESQIAKPEFERTLDTLEGHGIPQLLLVRGVHPLFPIRRLKQLLDERGLLFPLGAMIPEIDIEQHWAGLASEIGGAIADDLLSCLVCPTTNTHAAVYTFCQKLMQSTRVRLFTADFISCPSCGRTFFDLETTTAAIKERTEHLKGVKIGIMGCIVNGPGEMADADFGYVGSGEGKINLYKGQDCVERNIPEAHAVDRLIELIREHGQWMEPNPQ